MLIDANRRLGYNDSNFWYRGHAVVQHVEKNMLYAVSNRNFTMPTI